MSNFDLPVFGASGLEQGSFQSPRPSMEFRDRSAEQIEGERRYNEVYARLYPTLHAAMSKRVSSRGRRAELVESSH